MRERERERERISYGNSMLYRWSTTRTTVFVILTKKRKYQSAIHYCWGVSFSRPRTPISSVPPTRAARGFFDSCACTCLRIVLHWRPDPQGRWKVHLQCKCFRIFSVESHIKVFWGIFSFSIFLPDFSPRTSGLFYCRRVDAGGTFFLQLQGVLLTPTRSLIFDFEKIIHTVWNYH